MRIVHSAEDTRHTLCRTANLAVVAPAAAAVDANIHQEDPSLRYVAASSAALRAVSIAGSNGKGTLR